MSTSQPTESSQPDAGDQSDKIPVASAVAPDTHEELSNALIEIVGAQHNALPYLFVGSGISRRYLGLPDWEGLLRIFAEDIGENFNYHLSTANGDYPAAASSIASAFHPHWWKDAKYATQVAEHEEDAKQHQHGALKVAVSEYVKAHQELMNGRPGVDDVDLAAEVAALRTIVVDGVITTNYDSLTDQIFPSFPSYVGQEELMFSDAQFIAETYKIHGSAERPQSLVLTGEDYADFSNRNHYLAAKLLTIFAEHPVLFVGYSLNDEYLGEILGNIATAVGPSRLKALGKRICFVEWNPNSDQSPSIETANIERAGKRLPITRIETNSFQWIWDALGRLERPFPAKVLRELRKHVFELVTNPDPADSREIVRAIPIDADEAGDVRVVFGVGQFSDQDLEDLSTISARTLTRADLEQDVLGVRARSLDPERVLQFGIPDQIRPPTSAALPVHKYLAESGRISPSGAIDFSGLKPIIQQLAERPVQSHSQQIVNRYEREVAGVLTTPQTIMASDLATYFKLECLLLVPSADLDLVAFRQALIEFYRSPELSTNISYFRKVLVRYDRLVASAASESQAGASPTTTPS